MELIYPTAEYYHSYREAIEECRKNRLEKAGYLDMEEQETFCAMKDYREGRNLPDGYVPSTYLWLVDGMEFIGEINIRHKLTEALERFGGHIGYWVRPSFWNRGMGTEMLKRSLPYIRENLGLPKVLITCGDDNLGSIGVIEKNGGVLEDKIRNNIDGKERLTRRYWIEL